MSKIGAVILAAGTASRMKQQKLLLPFAGQTLLGHVLTTVSSLPWTDCIAVIGEPEAELSALCHRHSIRSIYNPQRQQGQATTIALAMRQLTAELDGILFLLGDQPLVPRELLLALISSFSRAASDRAIIVPCYQGERHSPVLFGSYWRTDLAELAGDIGGRQLIHDNPHEVIELDWTEKAVLSDADTWEEYQKLIFEQKGI